MKEPSIDIPKKGRLRRKELIHRLWNVIQDNVRQTILESSCDREVAEERVFNKLISTTTSSSTLPADNSTVTPDSVWALSQTEASRAILLRRELALLGDAGFSPNDSILQLISRLAETVQITPSPGVVSQPDSLSDVGDTPTVISETSDSSSSSSSSLTTSNAISVASSTHPTPSVQAPMALMPSTSSSPLTSSSSTSGSSSSSTSSTITSLSSFTKTDSFSNVSSPLLNLVDKYPLLNNSLKNDHSMDQYRGSHKLYGRGPRNSSNKRRKNKRKKMDAVRLDMDVVELDMLQDPIADAMNMNLDLDRDTVEKIKRFPRLRQ